MTSYRQIEANRRNALKSTGPRTEAGKQASRCNAVRHGLTAETVITALEDAEDYKAFEVTAGDGIRSESPNLEFARCFLRLANLPNFALDRLSRYEANLWRQAGRILFARTPWTAGSHNKGHVVLTMATVPIKRLTILSGCRHLQVGTVHGAAPKRDDKSW